MPTPDSVRPQAVTEEVGARQAAPLSEAELQRKARRQALVLMAASSLFTLLLLVALWLAVRYLLWP